MIYRITPSGTINNKGIVIISLTVIKGGETWE
jgi:hypothetical protein